MTQSCDNSLLGSTHSARKDVFQVDSLMESAFGSNVDTDWEYYRIRLDDDDRRILDTTRVEDQFDAWRGLKREHDPLPTMRSLE